MTITKSRSRRLSRLTIVAIIASFVPPPPPECALVSSRAFVARSSSSSRRARRWPPTHKLARARVRARLTRLVATALRPSAVDSGGSSGGGGRLKCARPSNCSSKLQLYSATNGSARGRFAFTTAVNWPSIITRVAASRSAPECKSNAQRVPPLTRARARRQHARVYMH